MIMTKQNLKVTEVRNGKDSAEVMAVQLLVNGGEKTTIITAYVSLKTESWNEVRYNAMQEETVRALTDKIKNNRKVLLTGDFNCKAVKWEDYAMEGGENTWGSKLLKLATNNLLTQWVKGETRLRGDDQPSRLDLIFTKNVELDEGVSHECPLGKSDHELLEIKTKEGYEYRDEAYKEKRKSYAKADYVGLKTFFAGVDWSDMKRSTNIQKKYDFFMDMAKKDWFNARCAKAKEKRDKAWSRLKRNKNQRNREDFKATRNEYVKVRKEEEKRYEKDIVEKCKEQPKLFYRFINGKIKSRETIERLTEENVEIEDPKGMAELFNKKFQQEFTKESLFNEPQENNLDVYMEEVKIDKEEIKKLLGELEEGKAVGPDGVSGFMLKECRNELVGPIYDIIRCSIKTGTVPREWKRAEVVPIYKSGKKEEPLNYRPVSLTSVVCKICEKLIKEQWMRFLEHNLITNNQYGFRKGRSCVTNLLSFYSRVTDKLQERDGWVDCIYLDLMKAFDKVPHSRLLWKLENKGGLRGKMKCWMESYLRGREMRTVVKDTRSEWRTVESGVPQGSVLAPVLFLVCINDMPEGINSYMSLFADDAKLQRHIRNSEDCKELQEDLNKIWKWSQKWEMKFNVRKCHVMEMGKSVERPKWTYKMGGGEILKKVNEERDLGVIMQDYVQPGSHINWIFGDTYNMVRNIGIAFHYMDKEMMKKLITAMIRPKLEYMETLWSPHMKKHIVKLERIQRMATKMVPELEGLTYEERLKEMDLPTLEQRRERGDLIQIYRLLSKMEEVDNEKLLLREEPSSRNTRGHSKKLRKGRCSRDIKKYSFPQRNIEVWNRLSEEIVSAKSVQSFKEKLDNYRYGDGTTRA
ncbi:uncharacterized protein LOC126983856 [Eriocheir sinensis]|uniref:uncharacterized protein LOC126983856 n=1 Tax=Eriocheir sinensis TaxID=95602 RepID=UPI0021C7E8B6|nr:uncharacterized protein LOC126983856 [Eriocheir sinensis]